MQNNQVTSFMEASGAIGYNMTNNYMFRYILQNNEKVLKGLICSLLHLKPEQIKKVEITNPINLAGDVTGKEFILDVEIMLNDDTLINLEMQVANEFNWPERSLSYLCRSYDQLYRGQKYEDVLPVIHIGFLDFTLHPEDPEFYATYKLLNVKNHRLYSSKFVLSVVNLNQIKLATEEDKAYNIDYWARIFKAKTWEEIKMLAKDNEYLHEAAESLYVANADEIVRQQCIARENAERRERTLERDNKALKQELNQKNQQIQEKDQRIHEKDQQIHEKDQQILEKEQEVIQNIRNLFLNGVDYSIVRNSFTSLPDEKLQAIFKEVTGSTYHE